MSCCLVTVLDEGGACEDISKRRAKRQVKCPKAMQRCVLYFPCRLHVMEAGWPRGRANDAQSSICPPSFVTSRSGR